MKSLSAAMLQAAFSVSGSFLNLDKVWASALYRLILAASGSGCLLSRPDSAA